MEYIIFIGAVIAVIILSKILAWPIKKITKLIINICVGIALLVLVNYIGRGFNFNIRFNIVTALISGFLGAPGVLLLVILKIIGF